MRRLTMLLFHATCSIALLTVASASLRAEDAPFKPMEVVMSEKTPNVNDFAIKTTLVAIDPEYKKMAGRNGYNLTHNGHNWNIFLQKGDARVAVLFADSKATLSTVNEWNRAERFTRAYLDGDNNAVLEADIDFASGITIGSFAAFFGTFETAVLRFAKQIE